jgi:hypothetical protein
VAERADEARCGERFGLVVARLDVARWGACLDVARWDVDRWDVDRWDVDRWDAAVWGACLEVDRGAGAVARDDGRGAPDRSDDGRPADLLRGSGPAEEVGRALRAAGVTAVGVMLWSDLQLAGGAQVR